MRRLIAALGVALLATAPTGVAADTLEPSSWPPELGLGSAPNAIRFGGTDRYHTALAASLALRGTGGFPFDSPDRTTGAWWGAATCPASIIVVAGDTPADALAAASLSDPTNRSNEPRLQRVASADPFFDPVGDTDRVDTNAAPIIVTTSRRAGARALAAPARAAAIDLRSGGCTSAREAIIVGGEAAVPVEVEAELIALGYEEVFRAAGVDRFATAARIASALGTEAAPPDAGCVDPRADDGSTAMGFYGNAVIEYRPDATSCELRGRTVLLADGEIGADALAAGWWTSYWQVPVLLVAGDGSLPSATRAALQSLAIDTIVVLGGTGRIPEAVVEEAARLATAAAGRFAGRDRYETSVESARVFGGWYPTGDGNDFAGDRVCLAASSGTDVGWPDALAAGPWCGRLSHLASSRRSPSRMLEPVDGGSTTMTPPRPAHDAAPVLLVPAGGSPTRSVTGLLASAFSTAADWCVGATTFGCEPPGFAVAFGGSATVSDDALGAVSVALSGGDPAQRGADPVLGEPYRTQLDLAPVYVQGGAGDGARGCFERGALDGARWLAVYEDAALEVFDRALDLTGSGTHVEPTSRPTCVGLPDRSTALVAVSAAGRSPEPRALRGEPERTVTMTDVMVHPRPRADSGDPATSGELNDQTSWRFQDAPATRLLVVDGDDAADVRQATVRLYLTQGADAIPTTFIADVVVDDGGAGHTGQARGEAVREGNRWELAGRFRLPGAAGGFRATLDTRGTPDNDDDRLTWRIDAVRP